MEKKSFSSLESSPHFSEEDFQRLIISILESTDLVPLKTRPSREFLQNENLVNYARKALQKGYRFSVKNIHIDPVVLYNFHNPQTTLRYGSWDLIMSEVAREILEASEESVTLHDLENIVYLMSEYRMAYEDDSEK